MSVSPQLLVILARPNCQGISSTATRVVRAISTRDDIPVRLIAEATAF